MTLPTFVERVCNSTFNNFSRQLYDTRVIQSKLTNLGKIGLHAGMFKRLLPLPVPDKYLFFLFVVVVVLLLLLFS